AHTGHIPHRTAVEVADPHADGVTARGADAPVVAHALAGAGLDRRPEPAGERAGEPERDAARRAVGKNIGDDITGRALHYALPRDLDGRSERERPKPSAADECPVRVRQLPQADLG